MINKIYTKYSKNSEDIAIESTLRYSDNKIINAEQKKISDHLNNFSSRENCLLCRSKLKGKKFIHRGIPYLKCEKCNHIQTKSKLELNYPYSFKDKVFEKIYPDLDEKYNDRVKRIYEPKLNWILESIINYKISDVVNKSWIDLGCGAGYFKSFA